MTVNEVEIACAGPTLRGEPWLVAPSPDLSFWGLNPEASDIQPNQVNDHSIFQSADGVWHLWACVRGTAVGRLLCHWESDNFFSSPWRLTGDFIRPDNSVGESLVDYQGEDFIQSPFVVRHDGMWYMFYGGYDTGLDPDGRETDDYNRVEKQICLMTSPDGRVWRRHLNEAGLSRLFAGPGAARDPFVGRFGDTWFMYYSGHHGCDRNNGGIYLRTSQNLLDWSDWRLVHYDAERVAGSPVIAESPFVIERDGWYYLFRSSAHPVKILRSRRPDDFGFGDCREFYYGAVNAVAPEIVNYQGNSYISTIMHGGIFQVALQEIVWD